MSQSFQALGVSAPVVRALGARNIHRPFAVQELVLPDALGGLDILAEAPTGSGKTLAFGLPLVERTAGTGNRPAALVLVPTRELAMQVADDLRPLAEDEGPPRRGRLRRRVPSGRRRRRRASAHVPSRHPAASTTSSSSGSSSSTPCERSSWTRPTACSTWASSRRSTASCGTVPANRQTMLFSATLDGGVAELARAYTSNAARFRAELPADRRPGTIEHTFVPVTPEADRVAAGQTHGPALAPVRRAGICPPWHRIPTRPLRGRQRAHPARPAVPRRRWIVPAAGLHRHPVPATLTTHPARQPRSGNWTS